MYRACIALASPALGNSADNSQLWVTNSRLHHAQCYAPVDMAHAPAVAQLCAPCKCYDPMDVAYAPGLWHRYCCSTGLGNSADHLQLWTSCTMLSIYTGLMAQVFIVLCCNQALGNSADNSPLCVNQFPAAPCLGYNVMVPWMHKVDGAAGAVWLVRPAWP